jgi:hypothetical protein
MVVLAAGLMRLPVEPDCPQGAVPIGASPPEGFERYCASVSVDGSVLKNGWYTSWFENGQKAAEGEFHEGRRTGQWLRWWSEGQKFEELQFQRGALTGPYRSWYRGGLPSAEGAYTDDRQVGFWSFRHENGRPAASGSYVAGLQSGTWEYLYETGALLATASYSGGLPSRHAVPAVNVPLPRTAKADPISATVDSRIELLSAALMLTSWPNLGPWSTQDSAYRADMQAAFLPFRDHAAVRMLDAMVQEGFTFDVPVRWILHFGEPPGLEDPNYFEDYVRRRVGGDAPLRRLAAAFRDFAREAKFSRFYALHRSFYANLEARYRGAEPPESATALIEGYLGERMAGYNVLIAPLFGDREYGFALPVAGGKRVYAVGAPQRVERGEFAFDREAIRRTLYREFNRGLVEPAIEDAFGKDFRPDLYRLVKADMNDAGYPTWRWALTEMAVRAVEIRLLRAHGFASEADEALRKGLQAERFVWLPHAVDRLVDYEAQRDRYPTFRSFAGRLLQVLEDTTPVVIGGKVMFVVKK